jgi:enamine deaminase RidA (YjgF/YER057c/UK114 family)
VVIFGGIARWVEVADDASLDARGQMQQIFDLIDVTLARVHSRRERLLEVTIFLSDLSDAKTLNALWDAWVVAGQAPIRACVQAGLSGTYRVEMIIYAAVDASADRSAE